MYTQNRMDCALYTDAMEGEMNEEDMPSRPEMDDAEDGEGEGRPEGKGGDDRD